MTPLVRNVVIGSVAGLAGVGILVAALRRPASQEEIPPVTPPTPIADRMETISLESDPFKPLEPVSSTTSVGGLPPLPVTDVIPPPPPPVDVIVLKALPVIDESTPLFPTCPELEDLSGPPPPTSASRWCPKWR